MKTTVPQTDRHLNETPDVSFLFAAITAKTPREIKALGTTIARGFSLLEDGYAFVRANAAVYIVANPDGETYNLAYDPAQNVASCTCEACVRLGVCKHLVCLHVHKAQIDTDNDQREARAREYDAPQPLPAGDAWDRWNAFFNEVDASRKH